jgi:hypothetical protein
MLPTWNGKAYIIYHVFAGMQVSTVSMADLMLITIAAKASFLSRAARISEVRRKRFATSVVTALQDLLAPRGIEGVSLFNPIKILTLYLASLKRRYDFSDGSIAGLVLTLASKAEICLAIGLPSAMTYLVVESKLPWEPIPDMAQLRHRLNRDLLALMAPPARLDSRGDRNLGVSLVVRAGHADRQGSSCERGELYMNNGIR